MEYSTDETKKNIAITKATQAIDGLKKNISILKEKFDISLYQELIPKSWQIANIRTQQLLNYLDGDDVEYQNLVIEINECRIELIKIVVTGINKGIENVKKTGDEAFTLYWINELSNLQVENINSYQKELNEATNHFLVKQEFHDYQKEYNQLLNDYENATKDYRETELYQKIDSLISRLRQYKDKILSFEQWIDHQDKIEKWIEKLQEIARPLKERHSEAFTNMVVLGDYVQPYNAIQTAITDKKNFTFFVNDDLNNDEKIEMPASQAEKICLKRWRKFSKEKYENKYFPEVEKKLGDGSRYQEDPKAIKDYLTEQSLKELRPIQELGIDLQVRYKNFVNLINKAIQEVENLRNQIKTCVDNPTKESFTSYRQLVQLKNEIDGKAPCLEEEYQQYFSLLQERVIKKISRDINSLREIYKIDLKTANENAAILLNNIAGLSEFNHYTVQIEKLIEITSKAIKAITEAHRSINFSDCISAIEELIHEIGKSGEAIPEELSQTLLFLQTNSKPVEHGEKIRNKYKNDVSNHLDNPDDISLDLVMDLKIQLANTIPPLRHQENDFAYISDLLSQLQIILTILILLETYLLTRRELKKSNADLNKIAKNIAFIKQNSQESSYQIPENKIQEIEIEYRRQFENDNFVKPILIKAKKIVESGINSDISDSMKVFNELKGLDQKPTTYRTDLNIIKQQLMELIKSQIEDRFNTLSANPKSTSFNMVEADNWLSWLRDKYPNHVHIVNYSGSLSEARARQAFVANNYRAAIQYWEKAQNEKRQNANAHRLACKKLFVLLEAGNGNYYPVIDALRTEPAFYFDVGLKLVSIQYKVQEIDEKSRNPAFLKNEPTTIFNEISNQLFELTSLDTGDDEISGNTNEPGTNELVEYRFIWETEGYQRIIDQQEKSIIPAIEDIRNKITGLENGFCRLNRLIKMVNPEANLCSIRDGLALSRNIKSTHNFPSSVPLPDRWEKYKIEVIEKVEASSQENYQFEKELKKWILEEDDTDARMEIASIQMAEAIVDLNDQVNHWTSSTYIQELTREDDEHTRAQVHVDTLTRLLNYTVDLKRISLEHCSTRPLQPERFTNFNDRFHQLQKLENTIKKPLKAINSILEIVIKVKHKITSVYSLYITPDDINGYEYLLEQISIINQMLDEELDYLKQHPSLTWCTKELTKVRNIRHQVEVLLKDVSLVYQLDRYHGMRYHKDHDHQFSDLCRKMKEKNHPSPLHYTQYMLTELNVIDPENLTNWKEKIQFGDLLNDIQIRIFLENETSEINKITQFINKYLKQKSPDISPEFRNDINKANYGHAYSLFIDWLGFGCLQNNLKKNIDDFSSADAKDLLHLIKDFQELSNNSDALNKNDNETLSNSIKRLYQNSENILRENYNSYKSNNIKWEIINSTPSESILGWSMKLIEQMNEVKAPGPASSSSKYREELYQELKQFVEKILTIYQSAQGNLTELLDLSDKWKIAYGEARYFEENLQRFPYNFFHSKKLDEDWQSALQDCKKIAPENQYVITRLKALRTIG